ncbi:tetratricopeptide repeat protein [Candidatus Protofrankia datiscae]|uniref:tetratricopeptide repeat protein n=2 Tax=Protofrankia TaxID=2994361 RepID=UPI003D67F403
MVATLWELSTNRLRAQQPAAVALLELAAFCAPEAIPPEWFTATPDTLAAGPLRDAAADRLRWAETVGALVSYHLAGLYNGAAGYLLEHGQPGPAIDLLQRALTLDERLLGPDHPDTLASRSNLALAMGRQGGWQRPSACTSRR